MTAEPQSSRGQCQAFCEAAHDTGSCEEWEGRFPGGCLFFFPAEVQQVSQPHYLFFIPQCSVSSHKEATRNPAPFSSAQRHSGSALQSCMAQRALCRKESDTKNAPRFYMLHSQSCSDSKWERGRAETLVPHPAPSVTTLGTARAVRQGHRCPRRLLSTANYTKASRRKQKDPSQGDVLRGQMVKDNFWKSA